MTNKQIIASLDWPEWRKDDLLDVIDKYPNFLKLSIEEQNKIKTKLYWEAEGLINHANYLESLADTIQHYIRECESD